MTRSEASPLMLFTTAGVAGLLLATLEARASAPLGALLTAATAAACGVASGLRRPVRPFWPAVATSFVAVLTATLFRLLGVLSGDVQDQPAVMPPTQVAVGAAVAVAAAWAAIGGVCGWWASRFRR